MLWKRYDELVELLDRVRNSRHGQLLAQVDRLVDQLRELKQRRTINTWRLGDEKFRGAARRCRHEEAPRVAGAA